MRRLTKSKKLGALFKALGDFQMKVLPVGARALERREIVSVEHALATVGGTDHFRDPMPDVAFPQIVDIDTNDQFPDLRAPVYDAYLSTLKDVSVFGGSSFVLGANRYAINDVAADPNWGTWAFFRHDTLVHQRRDTALWTPRKKPTRTIPRAFHLSGYLSEHFGHWICEYLPKLRHLERLPDWKSVPLLINDDMPASHSEALGLLSDNPVIEIARSETVHVQELLVAPTINFMPPDYLPGHPVPVEHQGVWSPEAMRYMRNTVLGRLETPSTDARRVFISRRNSYWARPTNEDAVEDLFEAAGFDIIHPENMSFTDQVRLMQSANFIAGPSGSAFNLAMFARQDAQILVLAQGQPHNWGGWLGPIRELGLKADFVLSHQGSTSEKQASYEVDVSRLSRIVDRLQSR